ncbi:hypothetical protein E2C01_011996 [Portunus trituberculatus]|uniref:Uncharacterized protein n=1 Tax=Portunus trituberculatus TaxID=210409 RepID=A0A5B7DCS7_PORTR|nr:hypothetical protein [Portunus trituberculatus]
MIHPFIALQQCVSTSRAFKLLLGILCNSDFRRSTSATCNSNVTSIHRLNLRIVEGLPHSCGGTLLLPVRKLLFRRAIWSSTELEAALQ